MLRTEHLVEVKRIIREGHRSQRLGLRRASQQMATVLAKHQTDDNGLEEYPAAPKLRRELRRLRHIRQGVPELATSPATLFALTDRRGIILVRDAKQDRLRGTDYGRRYPIVRKVLKTKRAADALVPFRGKTSKDTSYSRMYVQPVLVKNEVRATLILAIPLWKTAQRLSTQLRMDHAHESHLVLWAYVFRRKALFEKGIPPEVVHLTPKAQQWYRRSALRNGGTFGTVRGFGLAYGWAAFHIEGIGPDAGVLLMRANPSR